MAGGRIIGALIGMFRDRKAAGERPLLEAVSSIANALDRNDIQIERGRDVADATNAVVDALDANPNITIARTTTAARDPVNWTQYAGIAATLLAWVGLDVEPQTLVAIGGGIQAAVLFGTMIVRKLSRSVSV